MHIHFLLVGIQCLNFQWIYLFTVMDIVPEYVPNLTTGMDLHTAMASPHPVNEQGYGSGWISTRIRPSKNGPDS